MARCWSVLLLTASGLGIPAGAGAQETAPGRVDYRYAPPEWQTAICLPDDPHKTLVDRSGELLYHYGQGGREFATRVGTEAAPNLLWQGQQLVSARVPIVQTRRAAGGLDVLEEAFAVTELPEASAAPGSPLRRLDTGGMNRDWASPPQDVDRSLRDIAVHMGGNLGFEMTVPVRAARRVAMGLCEGWWKEPGKRVQLLRVEGAEVVTVDTVADIGPNQAAVFWFDARDADGDGRISIAVDAAAVAADKNTMLNGLWVFAADTAKDSAALLRGQLNASAEARLGTIKPAGPARNDLIVVHVTNRSAEERQIEPRLLVDTTLDFGFHAESQRVTVSEHETITSSLRMEGIQSEGTRRAIRLEPLTIPAGQTRQYHILYSGGGTLLVEPATLEGALRCRERAIAYWHSAPLPIGRVQVPDPGIQGLVDSSIRNIWQAREVKHGLPVFQVGPTCYRGLWIVDGAFLLESVAMLGAGREARSGIAYVLSQQKPNGAFEVLSPKFYKENGIVLWTCVRHAMLTQDKVWLESVWPALEGAAGYIKVLRAQSLEDASALNDGLNLPGEIDGGLSGHGTGFKRSEFSNVHWNLVGLRAFIQAAHWLGREDDARRWQAEYDDLQATFRAAATRDTFKDAGGHEYVPIFMANEGGELPQRGQWTFCHAVYPGQLFAREDPLVASTLAMLQATEREGMVFGTGWDAAGIWNYFASFYGHAWLWQGNGPKAAQVLYAFANHAAPTGVWREEQSLVGEKFRKVGDMPHNWASAEFIRLTIHLLALDRGDALHLLEGLPPAWCGPGMATRLEGVATPFGPLSMALQVDEAGRTAMLEVKPLAQNCRAVVVHLPQGGTSRVEPGEGGRITFPVDSRNAGNTATRPGDMMADSPVTFPKQGALPAKFPPDVAERSEPVEADYYLFSSPCRSLAQVHAIQAAMPPGSFTAPRSGWECLRRTRRLLTEGGELRLMAVGDSIVNDSMRSGWVALLQEAYPKASIQATVYVRGGGGCQHYRESDRVAKYILPRRPDLVFLGGISQRDIGSMREVIHQIRAGLPEVEFLLATGAFGTADPRDAATLAKASHSGTGEYGRQLQALAAEEHCAFLDLTTPWAEYIRSSGLHPHRFYRDVVHANEFGEQILAKILMAFWTAPAL